MKQPKKVGRPYLGNVQYKRRIPPELVKPMDEFLKKLKDDPSRTA